MAAAKPEAVTLHAVRQIKTEFQQLCQCPHGVAKLS